jgi:hypothetical protein
MEQRQEDKGIALTYYILFPALTFSVLFFGLSLQ